MKKLILLLPVCAIFLFSSCKKNSTNPVTATGTITVTIDGSKQTFNVGAVAHLNNSAGTYELGIFGAQGSSNPNTLIMDVESSSAITAGSTYTSADQGADISYQLATGAAYQFDGTSGSNVSIKITSINSTNVQGTFSGVLDQVSGGSGTKTFTNGSFNLKITSQPQ